MADWKPFGKINELTRSRMRTGRTETGKVKASEALLAHIELDEGREDGVVLASMSFNFLSLHSKISCSV